MLLMLAQLLEDLKMLWIRTGFKFQLVIMEDHHLLLSVENNWEGQEGKSKLKMLQNLLLVIAKDLILKFKLEPLSEEHQIN